MLERLAEPGAVLAAVAALMSLGLAVVAVRRRGPGAAGAPPPPAVRGAPPGFATGFEIRRKIAVGGMGAVYEAFDVGLRRRVAIKRLVAELRANPFAKEGFLGEARIVAALQHPNIVQIHSIADSPEELYLVFEYVEGPTLQTVLETQGPLPLGRCRDILAAACSALAYAHDRKVLHRDLKPSNIMIDSRGEVKVMDFGIARRAKETLSRLTPGRVGGTLAYMAPEQHMGREKRESDLYALAACAYHMLTGRLPFPGPEFLAQKEAGAFPPLSGRPESLQAWMRGALARDPADRPRDAAEFLRTFEAAIGAG